MSEASRGRWLSSSSQHAGCSVKTLYRLEHQVRGPNAEGNTTQGAGARPLRRPVKRAPAGRSVAAVILLMLIGSPDHATLTIRSAAGDYGAAASVPGICLARHQPSMTGTIRMSSQSVCNWLLGLGMALALVLSDYAFLQL
jgi:hypothetical protein